MQANITVLDDSKFYNNIVTKNGTKLAKLSTFNNVKAKADKLMTDVRVVNVNDNIVPPVSDTPIEVSAPSVNEEPSVTNSNEQEQTSAIENQQSVEANTQEVKEEVNELPLTSKEVLESKKDLFGITAYFDINATVTPIESIQSVSRRLKTNPVVPGNTNRERNVNGVEHELPKEKTTIVEQTPTNTFNFESLPGVGETNRVDDDKIGNNLKIDEWLNKETGASISTSGDSVLNEVNDLKAVRDSTADSLATQKEILANLKKRIEENKALCEAKKEELRQENMALTQELNDVLAEINKLSDLEAEQNAFLGIEGNGKTM